MRVPKQLRVEELGKYVSLTLGLPASPSGWVIVRGEDFDVLRNVFSGKLEVTTYDGQIENDNMVIRVSGNERTDTPRKVFKDFVARISSPEESAEYSLNNKKYSGPSLFVLFFESIPIISSPFTSTDGRVLVGEDLYRQVKNLVSKYGTPIFDQLSVSLPVKFSTVAATSETELLRKASQSVELSLRNTKFSNIAIDNRGELSYPVDRR